MKRRLLAIFMTLAMTLSLLPVTALANEGENTPSAEATHIAQDRASDSELSGSCGNGLIYTVDDDHVLRITGSGPMKDYTSNSIGIFEDIPGIGETVAVPQIREVVIGEGVTHIGAYAFHNLEGPPSTSGTDGNMVESILIPSTVTSIGENALPYYHLQTVTVATDNPVYYTDDGVLFSKSGDETELVYYPPQRTADSYQIPDGVTAISKQMEVQCTYLESLALPATLKEIEPGSLLNWRNLHSISVDSENQYFYAEDDVLFNRVQTKLIRYPSEKSGTRYAIPDGVAELAEGAFFGAYHLESVDIPDGVTVLGESVFNGCYGLQEVSIPEGVTKLGAWAFGECELLSSVTIPITVREIGDYAFLYTNFKSVSLPRSLQRMGTNPFYESALTDIYYAGSQTEWNQITFASPLDLDGITLHFESGGPDPGVVTYPVTGGNLYFDSATGTITDCDPDVTKVVIPGTISGVKVTVIGDFAFNGCHNLTAVTIPDTVASIEYGAFVNCQSLISVTIPNSVESIDSHAFDGCDNLSSFQVDSQNEHYCSVEGVLFDRDMKTLVRYPIAISGSYVIPNGVTEIYDEAFLECSKLSSITIPNSVSSIGEGAFVSCSSLSSVSIPEGVTTIKDWTFELCTGLTSVTLPESLQIIEWGAFSRCYNLGSIEIPSGVSKIETAAFNNCTNLTGIYFLGDAPEINTAGTETFYEGAVLYYIEGKTGWSTPEWNGYKAVPFMIIAEPIDLTSYFRGKQDFQLGTRTLNEAVDPSDYDAFLNAILEYETVNDEVRSRLYDLLFNAQYRPNILGGTSNHKYPYQNSPDPKNPLSSVDHLKDGVLGTVKFSHAARGCMNYAQFAMSYVYGTPGKIVSTLSPFSKSPTSSNHFCEKYDIDTEKYPSHAFTLDNVKKTISAAVPGSHIRFNYGNQKVHSIVYLGRDAENKGFYYISFMGGPKNTNMYVAYTTYETIVKNGATYVGVWSVNNPDPRTITKSKITLHCPIDVTVSYESEILSSATQNPTASFGTMECSGEGEDRSITITLDYGKEYDFTIIGAGSGTMDMKVELIDDTGSSTDTERNFEDVPITDNTVGIVSGLDYLAYTTLTLFDQGECKEVWAAHNKETTNQAHGEFTYLNFAEPGSGYIEDEPENDNVVNGGTSGSSSSTRYPITVEDSAHGRVESNHTRAERGQTVTITVDPDEGYVLDRLIVRDSDGDRIDVEQKSSTRYTFEMPRGAVTIEATFVEGEEENVLPFRDVDVDDWFYDAVVYAYENGLMSGVSDREFAPNSTLTRAMVAQMLWAMEGKPQVNYLMQYADVGSGDWYAEAVRWASSQGIMSGYGDSQFGPNDPVTRQQLALILYNYAKEKDYDTTGGGMALREYSDYDAIADWAVTGLGWAVEHGLISGMGDGVLAPTGGATRAQVAQIFMNFCEDVAE